MTLSIHSPDELIAAVPHLLGFNPEESIVFVPLRPDLPLAACDGTFGNSIGTRATGPALDLGWKVTNWMKTNAKTLGVQYLIWQGKIWSVARSAEGWRTYDGGGMYDPTDVTGGHFDHLHFTTVN